ncbi:SusC/RagA family TonB-linked outer membrane protein [Chitinophaga rhizosphaerae]|uniref:SusC/RagA family TonB-linked outer membrane protein n=1 Tax=Chitinophaga rhizosphaerae TaxID=1864947 RepID=UPI00196B5409|nr:SusC/RagA family TonB-linked outer membrane protein [Chitinophaga rhizosphaerae]
MLLTSLTTFAQSRKITGKVSSGDGQPLPGVTVFIAGTSSGTISSAEGSWSLSIPDTATAVSFRLIGMETLVLPINGQTEINAVLHASDKQLQEVVVTALGISRAKKALGYSVQEVKSTELQTRPTNAIGALSGKVAGLQVISVGGNMGGSNRVLLRGINSISGNNQPLFVIDGITIDNADMNTRTTAQGSAGKDVGNTIQDLNPDDIESVNVLKGPAAAALYGTRAANGVIVITTKKGREGKGLDVTINSGLELERVVRLPERQHLYGGGKANNFQTATINGKTYNLVDYGMDESWGPRLDGTPVLHWYNLDPEFSADYLNPQPWVYPKHDATDFFRTGIATTNNVAVSGGNDKQTFRLSYTNKSVRGTAPHSKLHRNTLNFSGSNRFGKFLATGNFNYVKNQSTGRPWTGATNRGIMLEAFQWGQVQVDYDKLRDYKRADGTPRAWNRNSWENTAAGRATKYIDNPFWSAYESYLEENRDRFYGNVGLNYEVNNWLQLSSKINADLYGYDYQDRIALYSRSQSNYIEYNNKFSEFNYEFLANAKKTWNEFSLSAFAGGNIMNQKRTVSNAATQGGLIIPLYYNLKNANSVLNESNRYHKSIYSLFGSVSLGYKNILFLDGTIRNDWSSTLPLDRNSFAYPSVSSSFIVSELNGLKNASWLDLLKVRLSWAQVGNDTDPYQLQQVYEAVQSFNGNPGYKLPAILANSRLKPEITSSLEAGVSFRILKNRLGLDVTAYTNDSRNQIINIPTSTAFGYDSKFINAGKINNKGLEVTLTGVPVSTKDFNWDVSLNWSANRNKVVQLTEGVTSFPINDPNSLIALIAQEGESFGQLRGYDFVYDAQGNKVIGDNGSYLRTEQMRPLGSVLPNWQFGVGQHFTYKRFDAGFLVDGRVGGKVFSQTYSVGMRTGVLKATAENSIRENGLVLDGVNGTVVFNADGSYSVSNTKPNTTRISAQTWGLGFSNGPTTQSIFDATYVKLREITAGYTIPFRNKTVQQLRVSAYGRNLWNIYQDNRSVDPELTNSSGNIQGIEGGNIPVPATFGVNVQVKF